MRLDQYLVDIKKVRSRTQAKEAIQNGWVKVDGVVITKPSHPCCEYSKVHIDDQTSLDWVARSGEKLFGALIKCSINLKGKVCLDVGQSTGGFTQAMLKAECLRIVGVDVGRGQLNLELQKHPQVKSYESFDARDLIKLEDKGPYDFIAVDVSFISVLKIVPSIQNFVTTEGKENKVQGVLLIKPQFEVGKSKIKKGGVVDSPQVHLECEKNILTNLEAMGICVVDYFPSSLRGKDGNQEFICHIFI